MIAKEVMDSFTSHQLVAVFHYNDVTCQEWKRLRNKLSKCGIKLKVIPAKLSSRVNCSWQIERHALTNKTFRERVG